MGGAGSRPPSPHPRCMSPHCGCPSEWEGPGSRLPSPRPRCTSSPHCGPSQLYFPFETACRCPGTARPFLRPHTSARSAPARGAHLQHAEGALVAHADQAAERELQDHGALEGDEVPDILQKEVPGPVVVAVAVEAGETREEETYSARSHSQMLDVCQDAPANSQGLSLAEGQP